MGCAGASYCLDNCVKEGKARESSLPGLYFCLRLGLCESKIFKGNSFNTRCAQSPFYNLKPPTEMVKK